MEKQKSPPSAFVTVSVFLGINLLGIFCNVTWVWGNLSVYCASYSHNRVDAGNGQIAPWLVSLNTIGLTLGVLVCGKLRQAVGLRVCVLIGILLFNGGVCSTYFTIRYSTVLLDFTLGLLPGVGMGIIQGNQYTLVVRWTERYQGLAASSVESTCVLGSVLINPIVTIYANPDNLIPNQKVGRLNLFSQQQVLDRVESTFLVYGVLSLVVNCLGFFLTRDFPGDECYVLTSWYKIKAFLARNKSLKIPTENSPLKSAKNCWYKENNYCYKKVTETGTTEKDEIKLKQTETKDDKGDTKVEIEGSVITCGNENGEMIRDEKTEVEDPKIDFGNACDKNNEEKVDILIRDSTAKYESYHSKTDVQKGESKNVLDGWKSVDGMIIRDEKMNHLKMVESGTSVCDTGGISDLGPRDVLKTRVFYSLWLTMGVADFTFIVVTTYFKAFGLIYIHDDHFLASLETVLCVVIALISYCGGFAVDKWGVKNALVYFMSALCVFSSFYYISPSISKWLYLVVCAGYGSFDFAVICLLSCVALKLWGETHLSTNYGLLLSTCFITNTVLPPVIETVIITFGWFPLFTSVSVSIFGALLLCVWQVPSSSA